MLRIFILCFLLVGCKPRDQNETRSVYATACAVELEPSTDSFWQVIVKSKEEARTTSGFEFLKKKYPADFDNYKTDEVDVKTATYVNYLFEFIGDTKCTKDDPKLLKEVTGHYICFKSNEPCKFIVSKLTNEDPCAKN